MNTKRFWNWAAALLLALLLTTVASVALAAQGDALPPATAEVVAGDAAVPPSTDNSTPGTALSLSCGQTRAGTFNAGQTAPQWYKFSANHGWTLAAGIKSTPAVPGTPLDLKMTLYRGESLGQMWSSDDDDGKDPLINLIVQQTNTYYLKVERKPNSGNGTFNVWLDLPILVSMAGSGTVDGIPYVSSDVLRYRKCSDQWEMLIDMSDLDVTGNTAGLAQAYRWAPNQFLVSFSKATTIGGEQVLPQDISYLDIDKFGAQTQGSVWPRYIVGSDIGLTKAGEAIDAIAVGTGSSTASTYTNGYLISLAGRGGVPGVEGILDDDVIRLAQTFNQDDELLSQGWSLYFDGSDVGLANVDIWGLWFNPSVQELYMSFDKAIASPGANAAASDIVVCNLGTTGPNTSCNLWYNPPDFGFDASAAGLVGKVDAIELVGP